MDKVLELDIASVYWNLTSLKDLVIQTLKERELYRSNHLYRGFNSHFVEQVLEFGSENFSDRGIYAFPESHLSIDPDPRWINSLSYARAGGALAVYNGNRLRYCSGHWYEFIDQTKKPKAVSTILLLNW